LARVCRRWQIDVIDSHLESAGLVSVIAGRMTGTPVSVTMYCGVWDSGLMIWPWTTRAALRFAKGVLTDSHIRSKQMSELVPGQERKFRVIPNGIPDPEADRTGSEMRKLLGLPGDPKVRIIAQIGRFTEYKGQAVLLRAARRVLDAEPDTAFLMVGFGREGSYKAHLNHLVRELRIEDRVVMTDYSGKIGDVWQAVDIHAHASLFDSLPISIAEGMSLGKPAVVSSAGGIPEIVQHGRTGLVVPPGDVDALAEAILRLLREPDLARELGQNARGRYEELYRPDEMVRALEGYFASLAAG
ncbi:MAG: glycosyltransferase family 4 protein, partial [Acidobacteriota bacterium]|nr:glycosyltransferase family 4 protein [Acidobacteriota bacterium]